MTAFERPLSAISRADCARLASGRITANSTAHARPNRAAASQNRPKLSARRGHSGSSPIVRTYFAPSAAPSSSAGVKSRTSVAGCR
jgi:hypothetical protein